MAKVGTLVVHTVFFMFKGPLEVFCLLSIIDASWGTVYVLYPTTTCFTIIQAFKKQRHIFWSICYSLPNHTSHVTDHSGLTLTLHQFSQRLAFIQFSTFFFFYNYSQWIMINLYILRGFKNLIINFLF